MSEHVLDVETWPEEAQAAINDVKNHVKSASISQKLKCTNQRIYLNLTTLEGLDYCIEMNSEGFKIVGQKYDNIDYTDCPIYETPYALLNSISDQFKQSFGREIASKLLELVQNQ